MNTKFIIFNNNKFISKLIRNMLHKESIGKILLATAIVAEVFVMLFLSFPRLDDLTWGSTIGLERLGNWFAGYNGRYIGNIIVIVFTRLPDWLRACLEVGILFLLFHYAHQLLPQKGAVCFFALALIGVPLSVYAQSVVWTAGFANYATSAAVMLFVLNTYIRIVIKDKPISNGSHIIFLLVTFLGQLILENTTAYLVLLSAFFLVYGLVQKKKFYLPVLTGLISTTAGAVLMFSNSSYYSALIGDGTNYKSLSLTISDLFLKYQNDIAPYFVRNNHIINIAMTVLLILLWVPTHSDESKNRKSYWLNLFGLISGACLLGVFLYSRADSTWVRVVSNGKFLYAVFTLFYAAYILFTILCAISNKSMKLLLLLFSFSQIVLVLPLVPASPISERCFFQNEILWALLIGSLSQVLLERFCPSFQRKSFETVSVLLAQAVCVVYLALVLSGQSLSWNIQRIRMEVTENEINRGAEEIVLPEVPWSSIYSFGANISNSNNYWISNYKRYYEIPNDTKLEFMDYYKWIAAYRNE